MAPPVKIYVKQFCFHFRLLEVLELPQLAETCVRNGHYEEALELKQYVTRLNKKLGSIPIVAEVVQVQDQLVQLIFLVTLGYWATASIQ